MPRTYKLGSLAFAGLIVTAAICAGCAATKPLQTDASTSGIRGAEEAGAADVPQAALHLQLAKEELAAAKALARKNEREQAVSMLGRAQADAELAIALSHGDDEKKEALEAMERVRQLRTENP